MSATQRQVDLDLVEILMNTERDNPQEILRPQMAMRWNAWLPQVVLLWNVISFLLAGSLWKTFTRKWLELWSKFARKLERVWEILNGGVKSGLPDEPLWKISKTE